MGPEPKILASEQRYKPRIKLRLGGDLCMIFKWQPGTIIKIFRTITDYLFQWLHSAPSVKERGRGWVVLFTCVCVYVCVYGEAHSYFFYFSHLQYADDVCICGSATVIQDVATTEYHFLKSPFLLPLMHFLLTPWYILFLKFYLFVCITLLLSLRFLPSYNINSPSLPLLLLSSLSVGESGAAWQSDDTVWLCSAVIWHG